MHVFRLLAAAVAALALACGGGSSSSAVAPPPDAPIGVTAAATGAQVSVSWTPVSGASSYAVFRAAAAAGPFTTQAGTSAAPPLVDSGLGAGETGYYVVRAIGQGGSSAASGPPVSATTAPGTVAGLHAALTPTGPGAPTVLLSWTATQGATSYDVQRGRAAAGPFGAASNVAAPSFGEALTVSAADFFYVVRAKNGAGAGPVSAPVQVTTPPAPPATVTATGFNGRVVVSWSAAPGATGYALFRTTTPGSAYAQVGGTVAGTSATDTTVTNATTYSYAVSSVGAGGTGALSTPGAQATPLRELCVVNSVSGTVAVFNADQNGDGAPLRTFGSLTRLGRIQSLAIDESTSDIYALDGGDVLVFPADNTTAPPRLPSGNVAPARTLHVSPGAVAIAIDPAAQPGPELMVASYVQNSCTPGGLGGCNQLSFYALGASGNGATTHTLLTPMPAADPLVKYAALDPVRRLAFTAGDKIVRVWNIAALTSSLITIAPSLTGSDVITALAWDATGKKASDPSRLLLSHTDLSVAPPVAHVLSFAAMAGSAPDADVSLASLATGVLSPSAMAVDAGDASGNPSVFLFDVTGGVVAVPLPLTSGSFVPKFRIGGTHSTKTVFRYAQAGAISSKNALLVVGDQYGAVAFFDVSGDGGVLVDGMNAGDIAPLAHLDGLDTSVFQPSSLDVDLADDKLVLVNASPNEGTPASISTYARAAQGDAAPAWRLPGLLGGEIFVQAVLDDADHLFALTGQNAKAHLSVFARTQTDYAPAATVAFGPEFPQAIAYDFAHHALLVLFNDVGGRIEQYTLSGGALTLAGTLTSSAGEFALSRVLAADPDHGELVVLNDLAGGVELRAFSLGAPAGSTPMPVAAKRVLGLNGNALGISFSIDPAASEWFLSGQIREASGVFTEGIAVYSRSAVTGALPLRTLGGAQTQLSGPTLTRVCN